MITYKIFLRTNQTNLNGTNTVCLRITQKRKTKVYSLKIYTEKKHWSYSKQLINKSDPKHLIKNKLIRKYNNKADNVISDYILNDRYLSFEEFEKNFFNDSYGSNSFYEFVENELKYNSKMYAYDSFRAYKSQLNKLKRFRSTLNFSEIDTSFLQAYKDSLHGSSVNTIYKALSFVKTYINKAIKQNIYTDENPFKKFPLQRTNGKRDYLTISELQTLEVQYNSNQLDKNTQNVLKYFLFSCYTGLRFSDIKALTYANIQNNMIEISMHKTKRLVRIPLIKKAQNLISENELKERKVFKVFTNQATNRNLKHIAEISKIDKELTFHVARHTFATNGTEFNIPIEIISQILGHSDLKTTQIYAKVSDNVRIKEMKKME